MRQTIFAIVASAALVTSAAAQDTKPVEDASKTVRDSAGLSPRVAMPSIRIQHLRPRDQRGIGVFEPPKWDTVSFRGFQIQWGAAFTQEFQGLYHRNTADPRVVNNANVNQLLTIGNGFNNAVANLYLDAQVADQIRVALTVYLSSRHHQEAWVKDGYFLIDGMPFSNEWLDRMMKYLTIKVGHFEIDYGDQHFWRTDNGEALYNPLVGNYILDAFTTEIGAQIYGRYPGLVAMVGITSGEVHGQVTAPDNRSGAYLAKLGFDKRWFNKQFRARLTGSTYGSYQSASNTLYTGDRAGSPYYDVIENVSGTATAWSGTIRPAFANVVHAYVANPYLTYRGFEFFGTAETATGKATAEARKRTLHQYAGDLVYRFARAHSGFVAGRLNSVKGQLAGINNDISVHRWQVGGGWFLTPLVVMKVEFVKQRYYDFPPTDIRNGAQFHGFITTGTVAF